MPSITFDGQSFLLDGRRVWLVSGSIPYARVPRAHWAERILAAKHAGLNCVETPIVWARHEPRQGQFDFTGENDIREFVRLVHAAGMFCIIRPGPLVDQGFDLGGLPPWLTTADNIKLRAANQPFLEACSRYITAVAVQLRDLQVNAPTPKGSPAGTSAGPIILLQNENGYTCGDDHLASTYLGELDRYFRESGFTVPIINANDLWQSVEGEIDGWTGYDDLLSHLRQLGTIRPAQPRIVIDFRVGTRSAWATPAQAQKAPSSVMRRIAEVLAAGGQFNLSPFHGGTYFGFSAGRDPQLGPAGFLCTSADAGAPLSETGFKTPVYYAARRICTFASRFSRVLSHLDPARQPVALLPESKASGDKAARADKVGSSSRVAVIHAVGSQGGVVFVFGDDQGHNSREPMSLLLPDGGTLPVDLGEQSVVWCLLETRLTGRANLDYCNLCALGLAGKVFVVFGAPGARAMLSINGSPMETTVPDAKAAGPAIQEHEGLTIVIANQEQIDHVVLDDSGVYLGVAGLDAQGRPLALYDAKTCTHIDPEGKVSSVKFAVPAHGGKRAAKPQLGEFQLGGMLPYVDGTSPRFANIKGPADLVSLGAPYGYGWYRLHVPSSSARKAKLMFPHAGHRLHVFAEGESVGIIGPGPGASSTLNVPLKKGGSTLVILAENLGRASSGADLGELTGIYNHAWEVEAIKLPKPKVVNSDPVDVLGFRSPLWRVLREDRADAHRLTWILDHRSKHPVIVEIGPFEAEVEDRESCAAGGIVLLNGKPIHFFQQGGVKPIFIAPELLLKGKNELQIALVGSTVGAEKALASHVHFYSAIDSPTAKAEWAFAKWEVPGNDVFARGGKGTGVGAHAPGLPAFHRATLHTSPDDHTPLLLDLAGMSKGQIYVGGKHLGRYFVSASSGGGGSKKVQPQHRYVVPRSWLKGENTEVVLFDEHGHTPSKVRVIAAAGLSAMGD